MSDNLQPLTASDGPIDWKDTFYIDIYLLAKQGRTESDIRRVLGASPTTWKAWKRSRAIDDAVKRGREGDKAEQEAQQDRPSIIDYCYGHLPAELRALWDRIEAVAELSPADQDTAYKDLKQQPEAYRQILYIHALVTSRFDATSAMRKCRISLRDYQRWCASSPDFEALVAEIQFHKGQFFENALLDQVMIGETQAILFANKSFNRDRGYGDKMEVEHTGDAHSGASTINVDLSKLDLTPQIKRALLEAVQEQRAAQARLEDNSHGID